MQQEEQMAGEMSFILWQMGDPGFQPGKTATKH
jgi:hypothetical protein